MRLAIEELALPLRLATAIDDEVAEFTHKDGWPKLDKVLSLAYHRCPWLRPNWWEWFGWLHRFADDLTASDLPMFCAVN